ncbi:BTAD domain-containing putative transcriptional regulator [Streptomyces sp. NPDC052396]|uniref:AfsR/SARP family transcriptional regulator n=1 Tax=Streptomyces sp. NPDC052396 TaxID=3365689 RepID=UPI0037D79463
MNGGPAEPCYSVLGAVEARLGGTPLALGSPQQRTVLAMLLLRRDAAVGLDELIDGLWGEEPPRSAVGTVRMYIHRLRRVLGPRIATHGQAYTLHLAQGALDLDEFQEQAARARARAAAGEPGVAGELLARALELWRGVPLDGLPGPYARIQRERLAELRLTVLLERIELDLRLGRHTRLVPELTGLCAEYPLNGRLRTLIKAALAPGGRAAEAARPVASALPPPAQLPYVPGDFTGRAEAVRALLKALTPGGAESVVIASVGGMGGVGKTTLAVRVAQRLRAHFPDGQLYANLRGVREDPADPAAVLAAFLRALGVPQAAIPDDPEGRAALYRSRLAGRRVLLVLDDARDQAQIAPLLPGSPACAVLVTSRGTLPELTAAPRLWLDVLPPAEALAMLGRIIGEERVAAEPAEAAALAERCGGLPLALRLAGARLATRPAWSLSDFVRLLDHHRPSLAALTGGEDGVAACFRLSYDLLDDQEARLFRLLALPRQGATDVAGAAALAGLSPAEAGRHLERMAELGLLESPGPEIYRYHDLLRAFAAGRSRELDRPEDRAAALTRLLDHFLASARLCYAVQRPGHPVAGQLMPTASPGSERQLAVSGHEAVLAVAGQAPAADPSSAALAADVLLALEPLLDGSFLWAALVAPARRILRAAGERGQPRAAGRAGYMLGTALTQLARFDEAERVLQDAESATRAAADEAVRTEILNRQALLRQFRGEWAPAEARFREAIAAGEACGSTWGVTNARLNSVSSLLRLGRLDEAAETCRATLAPARESGNRYGEAYALYNLGVVARHRGDTDEAIARHRESTELGVRMGYPAFEVLNSVSETAAQLAGNRTREAVECGERALAAARRFGWRAAEARTLRLLGTALAAAGEPERARVRLAEAVELLGALGAPEAAQASAALAAL